MSSDNEEEIFELEYGIDDNENNAFEDDPEKPDDEGKNPYEDEFEVPNFELNPRLNSPTPTTATKASTAAAAAAAEEEKNDDDEFSPLDDLMQLVEMEEDEKKPLADEEKEKEIKRPPKVVSSITITKITKEKPAPAQKIKIDTKAVKQSQNSESSSNADIQIFAEKFTGVRLVKSNFSSETELNSRLKCDYGQYYKLLSLIHHMNDLKQKDASFLWFTIFILSSKTETKCSAKGNNYVIWRITDPNSLDKDQDISLFLFGNAYKTHWKSSEFEMFALVRPDFMDNNSPAQQQQQQQKSGGNYPQPLGKKPILSNNWNKFASKKVGNNLQIKITLSIKAEYQLIPLGHAKDITVCQSFKQTAAQIKNEYSGDAPKRCKNLVNLQQAPYCIYHCKQLDKTKNNDSFGGGGGKYSMEKPMSRFGGGLFPATASSDLDKLKFAPSFGSSVVAASSAMKQQNDQREERIKAAKEFKSEVLMSLNSSISQSPVLSNVAYKTNKKSDKEIMAMLSGECLTPDQIKEIRLAEQATIKYSGGGASEHEKKDLSKLFSAKGDKITDKAGLNSVSMIRLNELKREQMESKNMALKNAAGDLESSGGYSNVIKQKFEEKKRGGLAALTSHRDILKEIKEKKKNEPNEEEIIIEEKKSTRPAATDFTGKKKIIASDFLKTTVNQIKESLNKPIPLPTLNSNKKENKKDDYFDLELYDGDSLVSNKKLFEMPPLNQQKTPAPVTTTAYKRKLQEIIDNSGLKKTPTLAGAVAKRPTSSTISPSATKSSDDSSLSIEERKAKKLKMIDEILSIKSNHAKDAEDPDKNPHMKAYFDRLEVQEKIDDRLSSITRQEVNAVTCSVCSYTAFSQSEYCRKLNHPIKRHKSVQRYFKCKICEKRTFTLDKMCPTSSCGQCGSNNFEPCGMKDSTCDPVTRSTALDMDSDLLLLGASQ